MFMDLQKVGNYTLMTVGVLTILSAIGTFFGTLDPLFQEWDAEHLTILVAIMKLIIGALVLLNVTRLFGALVAGSYYGGAAATHIAFESYNLQFVIVIILTLALWIGIMAKVHGER